MDEFTAAPRRNEGDRNCSRPVCPCRGIPCGLPPRTETVAVSFRGFCWLLVAMVPAYLGLAALLPPFDDELYYWCWSRDLQLSYYDHPPMVAYMIRGTTELFGTSVFAIRLPAVLSAAVVAA